jgi:hypothetical protein
MTEAERLHRLVGELISDDGYVTGRRAFPRSVAKADAVLISEKLQDAVEQAATARSAEAARMGLKIACSAGCDYCCAQLVMVWLPEAMRVAEFLKLPENTAAREGFLARYPAWKERVGDAGDRMGTITAELKTQEHLNEHIAYWRKNIMCALNHEGMCTVYAARPVVCRTCHALDTNEHCRGYTSHKVPAGLKFPPLDNFADKASTINASMHHALGGGARRTVALCQAVYELLTEAANGG